MRTGTSSRRHRSPLAEAADSRAAPRIELSLKDEKGKKPAGRLCDGTVCEELTRIVLTRPSAEKGTLRAKTASGQKLEPQSFSVIKTVDDSDMCG